MRKVPRKSLALPIHELAGIVPLANEVEQSTINESIKQSGFDEQLGLIKLWNGQIIDGRCRQIALLNAGLNPSDYAVEINYTDYNDVKEYVLKANERRNLTDTQKAITAWKMTKRTKEEGRMTQQEVFAAFGVETKTLQALNNIVKSIDALAKRDIDIYYIREQKSGTKRLSKNRQLSLLVDDLFNDYQVKFDGYSKSTTSIRMIASYLKQVHEGVTERSAIEWNPDSMILTEAGKHWYAEEISWYNLDRYFVPHMIELANFKFPAPQEEDEEDEEVSEDEILIEEY